MDHYEDYRAQVLERMPSSPFATSNPYGYHVDIMSDEVGTNHLAVTNTASSSGIQVSQWKLDLDELGIPLELEDIIDDTELPVCSNYGSFAFNGLIMKRKYKLVVIDSAVNGKNIGADADMTGNDQSAEQIRGCQICRVEFSNAAEKLCHDESVHHASKLPASAFYVWSVNQNLRAEADLAGNVLSVGNNWACKTCNEDFSNAVEKADHDGSADHAEKCVKALRRTALNEANVREIWATVWRFHCGACGKWTEDRDTHLAACKPPRGNNKYCFVPTCDKAYIAGDRLRNHEARHYTASQYRCLIGKCSSSWRTFYTARDLGQHLRNTPHHDIRIQQASMQDIIEQCKISA